MGTFASVSLYDRGSTRPVSGRTVRVTSWPDGLPVETDPAVLTTDYYGATPEFTVDGVDAVVVSSGSSQPRVLVSIEKQLAGLDLTDLEDRVAALEAGGGTSGSGIEYVSGVVTPDEDVAVHEYFTTGPATIDGVDYDAEQAVVLFWVQGRWVHKVVDLPRPPSVTVLGTHVAQDIPAASTKSTFTFTGLGAVPKDGLLVAALSSGKGSKETVFTVGGTAMNRRTTGIAGETTGILDAPVTKGASTDVSLTLNVGTPYLALTLLLVTGVSPVPYATTNPVNPPQPLTIPSAPAGSLCIVSESSRQWPLGDFNVQWAANMHEGVYETFPMNDLSWTMRHVVGWGLHPGGGSFVGAARAGRYASATYSAVSA